MKTYQKDERCKLVIKKWTKECKFKCPACGNIQSGEEMEKAGADWQDVYFNCIWRCNTPTQKGKSKKWCDRTLGGLLQIHKAEVIDKEWKKHPVFEFADWEWSEDPA